MKFSIVPTSRLVLPRSILTKDALAAMGEMARVTLQIRVWSQGYGIADTPMPAYTPAYAKRKARLGGQVRVRDLTLSGKLMQSIRVYGATAKHVFVGWTSGYGQLLAAVHQARSPFLGLSPSQVPQVKEVLDRWLAGRLPQLVFTKKR